MYSRRLSLVLVLVLTLNLILVPILVLNQGQGDLEGVVAGGLPGHAPQPAQHFALPAWQPLCSFNRIILGLAAGV